MTRVLLVIPSLTPEAGAETSVAAVLPYLVEWGVDVHLALLTANQGLVPQVEAAGVRIHDLSNRGFVGQVRAIRRLIRTLEPDLVHSTLFQASVPSQIAAIGTGIPSLLTWANTPTDPRTELAATWKLQIVRLVETAFAHLPPVRFHAVTDGVARTKAESLRVRPSHVAVAERGRDPELYRRADPAARLAGRAELGLTHDDLMLLAVGRQEAQKGYVDLLTAFDDAASSNPSLRLLIAGRAGSASADIAAVLDRMRHRDRVELLGHRDDIVQLMQYADAVVCASYREGAAGALIEAMACGVPIASVELDGMEGVLENGVNSVVVPRSRLASGMLTAVTDRDAAQRRADAAATMFHERFTIERSAGALLDVYRWVIGHGDAPTR